MSPRRYLTRSRSQSCSTLNHVVRSVVRSATTGPGTGRSGRSGGGRILSTGRLRSCDILPAVNGRKRRGFPVPRWDIYGSQMLACSANVPCPLLGSCSPRRNRLTTGRATRPLLLSTEGFRVTFSAWSNRRRMFSAPFESTFITALHPRQTYKPRFTRLASRFCPQHEHVFDVSCSLTVTTAIPSTFALYVSRFVKRSNAHPCKPSLPRSPQFRTSTVSSSSRIPSRLPTAIVPTPRSTHSATMCLVTACR